MMLILSADFASIVAVVDDGEVDEVEKIYYWKLGGFAENIGLQLLARTWR